MLASVFVIAWIWLILLSGSVVSVVSRCFVSFGALGVAPQNFSYRDKSVQKKKKKKRKGLGTKGPQPGQTQTQTKPPRTDTRTNTTKRNHRQTGPGPGRLVPAGLLYLLGRFSAMLPGLSNPVSYRKGAYPSRDTYQAGCWCERNAISRPIAYTAHTVTPRIGITKILDLESSLSPNYVGWPPSRYANRGSILDPRQAAHSIWAGMPN